MADASEMLQAFARMVAVEVAAILQPAPPKPYTQDDLPPDMTRGTYLDHCRRGDLPNRKIGRLRETDRDVYAAWREAHPERGTIKAKAAGRLVSGPHTIAPAGRSSPCAPGCRHGQCAALARAEVDALVGRVRVALLADTDPADAIEALDALAKLARGDR